MKKYISLSLLISAFVPFLIDAAANPTPRHGNIHDQKELRRQAIRRQREATRRQSEKDAEPSLLKGGPSLLGGVFFLVNETATPAPKTDDQLNQFVKEKMQEELEKDPTIQEYPEYKSNLVEYYRRVWQYKKDLQAHLSFIRLNPEGHQHCKHCLQAGCNKWTEDTTWILYYSPTN